MNSPQGVPFIVTFMFVIFPVTAMGAMYLRYRFALKKEQDMLRKEG